MTTISVVVATCNEGQDLEATVALLASSRRAPDELIVVDDGSDEPLEPRLAFARRYINLRVIRNERRTGSGRAKSKGLDAATGDLLIVMDSHMRPPWDFLDVATAAFEKWPTSIMCPWSYGFRHQPPEVRLSDWHHPPTFAGRGAMFRPDFRGFWDITWCPKTHPEPAHGAVIPCVLGGCYIFGREVMNHLGGYNRHHLQWGFEQEHLSLRAWVAGYDCRLLNIPVPHHYTSEDARQDWRHAPASPFRQWGPWHNRYFAMRAMLHDERIFDGVFAPLIHEHLRPYSWYGDFVDAIESSRADCCAMRRHLNAIRRRSDEEVAAAVGMELPTTREAYLAYAKEKGRSK